MDWNEGEGDLEDDHGEKSLGRDFGLRSLKYLRLVCHSVGPIVRPITPTVHLDLRVTFIGRIV